VGADAGAAELRVDRAAIRLAGGLCVHQEVVLVGGGNSAGQAAVFLAEHVAKAVEAPGFVYMGNRSAERMADFEIRPVVVQPTKRAVLSRHGYRAAQFEDAFARFLPPEPNIRTLKPQLKT